jgi:hypothetical protein
MITWIRNKKLESGKVKHCGQAVKNYVYNSGTKQKPSKII